MLQMLSILAVLTRVQCAMHREAFFQEYEAGGLKGPLSRKIRDPATCVAVGKKARPTLDIYSCIFRITSRKVRAFIYGELKITQSIPLVHCDCCDENGHNVMHFFMSTKKTPTYYVIEDGSIGIPMILVEKDEEAFINEYNEFFESEPSWVENYLGTEESCLDAIGVYDRRVVYESCQSLGYKELQIFLTSTELSLEPVHVQKCSCVFLSGPFSDGGNRMFYLRIRASESFYVMRGHKETYRDQLSYEERVSEIDENDTHPHQSGYSNGHRQENYLYVYRIV